jgi:large subunit ribosomal protein L1
MSETSNKSVNDLPNAAESSLAKEPKAKKATSKKAVKKTSVSGADSSKAKKAKSDKKKLVRQTAANLEEAVKKIQELSQTNLRKFNESLDIAIKLGIDAKQTDQSVKGSILLPHGLGKKVRIVVFTNNEDQKKIALESGAMLVGLEDLIAKIEEGFLDFDCCIATPEVMQKISKVAKKLGPRGLMPSPKNGTVTTDIKKAVSDAMKGKVDFKNDKAGIVHCSAGKVNFAIDQLVENIKTIVKAVKDSKTENSKGKFILHFYLNSTMGPAISVNVDSL